MSVELEDIGRNELGAYRDWCFTAWEKPINFDKEKIKYIIYGYELCPTNNREHYQGFAIFNRTVRLPQAKRCVGGGDRTHIKPRRGTRDQARDYCRKDGNVFEWGRFDPMTKEDLFKQPIEILKKDYPEFYCRYHRGLEKLQPKGPIERDMEIYILWGEPGTGKTSHVMRTHGESVYKFDPPYKWFDGYEGEEVLLIDDYKRGAIDRGLLLNILDRWRLKIDIKGSYTWALWTKVYITTNFHPDTFVTEAIRSRLERCKHGEIREVSRVSATG